MSAFNLYVWRDDLLATDLPTHSKILGLILLTFMNEKKHTAYPSIKRLAKLASMSPRACIKHIKNLVDAHFLLKLGRYDESKNFTNVYKLGTKYSQHKQQKHDAQVHEVHQQKEIGASGSPDRCTRFTNLVHEVHPNKQENKQENKQIDIYTSGQQIDDFRLQASESENSDSLKCSITHAPNNQRLQTTQNASTLTDEKFDRFWAAYPRKVEKHKARIAFNKLDMSDELFDEIMTGLHHLIAMDWQHREMQYIPHATTFINGERWTDEPTPPAKQERKLSTSELTFKELERISNENNAVIIDVKPDQANYSNDMGEHVGDLWPCMDSRTRHH